MTNKLRTVLVEIYHSGRLNKWEKSYIESMMMKNDSVSSKQKRILMDIIKKGSI